MIAYPPSAVFLDRDGVLIENVDTYVRGWEDVEIFDQAVVAVAKLTELGVPIFVVTNQAGVGRGLMTYEHVDSLNQRILKEIEERSGGHFLAAYFCPHHPDAGCNCRKPLPGMLLQAAEEHGIDLVRSVMVGDGVTDLLAAKAAGSYGVLVRTGRGVSQEGLMSSEGIDGPVFTDLLSAVESKFGLF